MRVRRVVTGTDKHGRSAVEDDAVLDNQVSRRPGHHSCVVWSSSQNGVPIESVMSDTMPPTAIDDGSVFRIIEYGPGVVARPHQTNTVDYIAVLSGSISLELDTAVVELRAGDVVVQRAAMHNWANRSDAVCRLAVVLLGQGGSAP